MEKVFGRQKSLLEHLENNSTEDRTAGPVTGVWSHPMTSCYGSQVCGCIREAVRSLDMGVRPAEPLSHSLVFCIWERLCLLICNTVLAAVLERGWEIASLSVHHGSPQSILGLSFFCDKWTQTEETGLPVYIHWFCLGVISLRIFSSKVFKSANISVQCPHILGQLLQ